MQTTTERQFVMKIASREREDLMYEVFLEKGLDVFAKRENFQRVHRPLVDYSYLFGI